MTTMDRSVQDPGLNLGPAVSCTMAFGHFRTPTTQKTTTPQDDGVERKKVPSGGSSSTRNSTAHRWKKAHILVRRQWGGKEKNCLLVEAAALGTALHTGGEEHTHTHTGKKMMGWKWEEKTLPSGQNEMTVKWKGFGATDHTIRTSVTKPS